MIIKKSIFLLLLAITMNGCVERGQSLNIPKNSLIEKHNLATSSKSYYALKINASDSKHDTLKNNVSGSILLIIGLIILL